VPDDRVGSDDWFGILALGSISVKRPKQATIGGEHDKYQRSEYSSDGPQIPECVIIAGRGCEQRSGKDNKVGIGNPPMAHHSTSIKNEADYHMEREDCRDKHAALPSGHIICASHE
jgi:hypothetical protein